MSINKLIFLRKTDYIYGLYFNYTDFLDYIQTWIKDKWLDLSL